MTEFIKKEEEGLKDDESYIDSEQKRQRQGMWNGEQLLKFMIFTYFNKQIMCSKLQRRTLKIFKKMALFIESRNSIQCRSQNQKLIKKYKSINKILKVFLEKVGVDQFNKHCIAHSKHPDVKYIINEAPPKEIAGHAVSRSTQTDFLSDSQELLFVQRSKYTSMEGLQYP